MMNYLTLMLGLCLTATFVWLFLKNRKRNGVFNAFLRMDTILGIIAGIYLLSASAHSLFG